MNTLTIKPDKCPFCGYTASIQTFQVRKGYEANVHCTNCLANMPTITYDTEEEAYYHAVTDWNTRTTTVETEPIKHGRWVHGRETAREMVNDSIIAIYYEDWQCSECKYSVSEPIWKFCPNCGALMMEGVE